VDNELEVIRHQMEEKRASLTDKLDALETEVFQTVHEATVGVSQIVHEVKSSVESVTEGVHETVESVKESLDIREAIRRNPWTAMGGAFALGLAGGVWLGPSSRPQTPQRDASKDGYRPLANGSHPPSTEPPSEPSLLGEAARTAMTGLSGLAIGALMGVLREVVGNALPPALKNEATSLLDQVTVQLGGKTFADLGVTRNEPENGTKGASDVERNAPEMGRPLGSAQGAGQEPVGLSDRQRVETGRRGLRANDRSHQRANGKDA
jgi:hypothetical protein